MNDGNKLPDLDYNPPITTSIAGDKVYIMPPSPFTLMDGSPVTPDHSDLKSNGQQKGYVILSDEERAKGFVRPVRDSYIHIGPTPPDNLRDLDDDEKVRYAKFGYVKYQKYGDDQSPVLGRYWTQTDIDRLNKGCGTLTRMSHKIAETYARDPSFYGGTFCVGCGKHFPVGPQGEFVWDGTDIRVGT